MHAKSVLAIALTTTIVTTAATVAKTGAVDGAHALVAVSHAALAERHLTTAVCRRHTLEQIRLVAEQTLLKVVAALRVLLAREHIRVLTCRQQQVRVVTALVIIEPDLM